MISSMYTPLIKQEQAVQYQYHMNQMIPPPLVESPPALSPSSTLNSHASTLNTALSPPAKDSTDHLG